MKGGVLLFLSVIISMTNQQVAQSASLPAHVSNSFQFVVRAPLNRAAPLFGPEGERCWAGQHWNPEFLYPQPGKDVQGAVFTVQHGPHTQRLGQHALRSGRRPDAVCVFRPGHPRVHGGRSTDPSRFVQHKRGSDLCAHCSGRGSKRRCGRLWERVIARVVPIGSKQLKAVSRRSAS